MDSSIDINKKQIQQTFGKDADLVFKPIPLGPFTNKAYLVYMDSLSDPHTINDSIVKPLLQWKDKLEDRRTETSKDFRWIKDQVIAVGDLKEVDTWEPLYLELLSGNTMLIADGISKALSIHSAGLEKRSIEEASSSTVIRGPREGFTEDLRTNMMLIRKRIRDKRLRCTQMIIGEMSKTDVVVMYMEGVAVPEVVQELFHRLEKIRTTSILESGNIEEYIQDKFLTPFPTVYNTERPDTIAAAIMEGRVAILVNGTPFVLLVPALFVHFFQVAEDYYQRADIAFFLRILRYIALVISLLAPALYIAISTFHQEMLPTPLLISLAAQREGTPFPAFIEAVIMEFTFEVLREAGVRLPRAVGQAVSIVGALVIGQAAVEAGIVSAAMVIVVSVTAITSFVFPSFNMSISIRMLRFIFMICAATFGLFGITVGLIVLILHLCSLKSFGVPYLSPFAPWDVDDQSDAIFRFPSWMKKKVPDYVKRYKPASNKE
ncbi:hypothetical protein SY83_19415 [Paenibacillus swuensis]|uniref:Uncharacterized protein n=1 Tax=Paenibacillus swuensis TaxID=1178515 RepID=A0A172TPP3_9BACL|nr:hypothetical protein SY83_19415 [Paenibacillus swuensis]